MHRRAVTCSMCGGKFFPASLPHHQKVCARRQGFVLVPCPHCEVEVPKPDLASHIKSSCPKAPPPILPSDEDSKDRPDDEPDPVTGLTNDGRMACPTCGRKFVVDRISKHAEICSRVRLSRTVFDSYSHRRVEGSRPVLHVGMTPTEKKIRQRARRRMLRESEDFRHGIRNPHEEATPSKRIPASVTNRSVSSTPVRSSPSRTPGPRSSPSRTPGPRSSRRLSATAIPEKEDNERRKDPNVSTARHRTNFSGTVNIASQSAATHQPAQANTGNRTRTAAKRASPLRGIREERTVAIPVTTRNRVTRKPLRGAGARFTPEFEICGGGGGGTSGLGGGGGFLPTNDTSLDNPMISGSLRSYYVSHHNKKLVDGNN